MSSLVAANRRGRRIKRAADVTHQEVNQALNLALTRLQRRERHLLRVNANERSLTHHLARYLQQQFKGWDVDVEYNRDREASDFKKRLRLNAPQADVEDTNGVTVFPDIIVHHRDTNENLLVIEVKKKGQGDHNFDHEKLRLFILPPPAGLGYIYGVHIVITTGPEKTTPLLTWFGSTRLSA